jgi:biopolymer transport protein ExbB/TolQ
MRRKAMFCFTFFAIFCFIVLSKAKACPVPLGNNASQRAEIIAKNSAGISLGHCEHRMTNVRVISGDTFQQVFVMERFKNNFRESIYGHYSIPLPQDAAIKDIEVRIGERWRQAMHNEGFDSEYVGINDNQTTDSERIVSLIDKDYSSTFAQPIPNIKPGEEIEISISYYERVYASEPISFAEAGTEDFCGAGLYRRMNSYVLLIYCILFFIFLYLLIAIIKRSITYALAGIQSRHFVSRAGQFLSLNRLPEAIQVSASYKKSPVANILTEVFKALATSPQNDPIIPELCGSARSRAIAGSDAKLRRGLRGLKATGWIALMIGCLGTIINLLDVCRGAMVAEGTGLSAVAGGITDSFTIAMFGLLIFMPAIWASKYFSSKATKIGLETHKASWELLDSLLKRRQQEQVTRQMYTAIWMDC